MTSQSHTDRARGVAEPVADVDVLAVDAATEGPADRVRVLQMPPRPEGRGTAGWLRWAWRSLTSMRAALILLGLLALAAVPGSLLPQRGVSTDPGAVPRFIQANPTVAPWLDRLALFDVYSSPWFAAIYLVLLTSMTGCVLPRCLQLWRACRAAPPRVPANLARFDSYRTVVTTRPAADVVTDLADRLRTKRFRVNVRGDGIAAEKGYLREVGNLLFHLSLLVLLFGVAAGSLLGFEGRVLVTEGAGFANTRSQYDEFTPGPLVDENRLTPFFFTLDDFSVTYEMEGPQRGTPRDFDAEIRVTRSPGGAEEARTIEVNHPLDVRGTKVFLTGNGYAPQVTVRDRNGEAVYTGATVFLPLDSLFASRGVIKAPGARPVQLGFEGLFLPTAAMDPVTGPYSSFPALLDPQLLLTAYTGDLGMDDGAPQSVYELVTTDMAQVVEDGQPFARALRPGDTMTLPGGEGSLTFDGVARFANFQVAYDPGKEVSLLAAIMLLVGLTGSLAIRRRRIWVRVRSSSDGRTEVELAAYSLTRQEPPPEELDDLVRLTGADPAHDQTATDAKERR